MPDPRVEDLERAAARHWQAPDTESWVAGRFLARLRAALEAAPSRYHCMMAP
jgi:hypothetical protein